MSQKARLLALLSDGQWHTTDEILWEVYQLDGSRRGRANIPARIYDLKAAGHGIESRKAAGSVWEYKLN